MLIDKIYYIKKKKKKMRRKTMRIFWRKIFLCKVINAWVNIRIHSPQHCRLYIWWSRLCPCTVYACIDAVDAKFHPRMSWKTSGKIYLYRRIKYNDSVSYSSMRFDRVSFPRHAYPISFSWSSRAKIVKSLITFHRRVPAQRLLN